MHPAMMHGPGGHGKVYPPNQPMVFNPSNPSAPPIYPCGMCHKEVSCICPHLLHTFTTYMCIYFGGGGGVGRRGDLLVYYLDGGNRV
jgi:hypothetical protein